MLHFHHDKRSDGMQMVRQMTVVKIHNGLFQPFYCGSEGRVHVREEMGISGLCRRLPLKIGGGWASWTVGDSRRRTVGTK
mmetsp:Transcript_45264/g.79848  ORF Transcript_45264/g.79848 Transcript_45264/m.79848 type:complete len:80 (+) Transcript_45264:164-403(+)